MALEVQIKALRLPGSRRVRVEFRGVRYYTRSLRGDDAGNIFSTDEVFEWLLASPISKAERLMVHVQRGWTHRQAWHVFIPLAGALRSPSARISMTQHLLDDRQRPLQATITLEILYTHPENSSAFLGPDEEEYQVSEDDKQSDDGRSEDEPLLDIQKNIKRLEKGLALREPLAPNYPVKESTPTSSRSMKRISTLRSVKNIMRLGKRRPSNESSTDEESRFLMSPLPGFDTNGDPVPSTSKGECPDDVIISFENDQDDLMTDPTSPMKGQMSCLSPMIDIDDPDKTDRATPDPTATISPPESQIRKPIPNMHTASQSHLKAQDFQVCLTILEARHLAGLNMDPVVCIQVGEHKKYTSVKESTNCPYYNEYFVFDFHIPPVMLFDKIIVLSVLQARNVLRSYKLLGSFKLDVATVWTQPDHQFYHKWAVLSDPSDPLSGPKGYLKCDICVIGKGDMVKVPPKTQKDEDDIEANLLLPDGVSTERQRARYIVYIHKADGLPKMNLSIMANVKKALTGEEKDLVDPYVQVCFAGLTGSTSVKRNTYNPVWNERVIFSDMFPPLCQRIRIQLRDHDPVKPTVIGTHYIDLKSISNDGERSKGFLPTYGPAYVHLYGSPRDYTLLDQHSALNAGLGEGVSYRARVLISIRTELTDNPELIPSAVDVEPCVVPNETCCLKEDDFLLFGAILDVSMIDKKIAEKAVSFELSLGNAGNNLDGHNHSSKMGADLAYGMFKYLERAQSTTRPMKSMSHDKEHFFLPLWDTKPCVHVISKWPDQTKRMFTSNALEKIVDNYDEGLRTVGELHGDDALKHLRETLTALHMACRQFVDNRKSVSTMCGNYSDLDKRRSELLIRELDTIATKSRHLKAIVTKSSFKERFKASQAFLTKLKLLVEDPQGTLPDVVIWAIGGGKRFAYQRVPARHLIYSPIEDEKGKLCGKTHTMFLRLPGKKAEGASGWNIPTKLNINLWLGLSKHKGHYVDGLPEGYDICNEIKNKDRAETLPPASLSYMQQNIFQLRAYIYQARSLIGSDASGLSDPFAKVIAGEYCKTTRVIDETLSPTWDQLLVLDDITVFGSLEQIKEDPPTIIIEIFDRDKVGKAEFIGRAMAKPRVKTLKDNYSKPHFPPSLEWYEITRGLDHAGELLATFELLQTTRGDAGELLPPPDVPELQIKEDLDYLPVPNQIRPTLAKYRIEILFWGLRNLKRVHFLKVDKPRVDIECAGNILSSSVIQNANKNPNFSSIVKFLDVELPEQELYRPPLTIRVVDCRSFGRFTLVGTHMINSIHQHMFNPQALHEQENSRKKSLKNDSKFDENDPHKFGYTLVETKIQCESEKEKSPLLFRELPFNHGYGTGLFGTKKVKIEETKKRKLSHDVDNDDDEDSKDWWTKYFASVDHMIEETKNERLHKNKKTDSISGCSDVEGSNNPTENKEIQVTNERKRKGKSQVQSKVVKLSPSYDRKKSIPVSSMCKVFTNELEVQSVFDEFKDWLHSFDLYRGKKTGDDSEDESRNVGTFKGAIKVYKWPLAKPQEDKALLGFDPQYGFFQNMPSNDPIRVLVRVYIVKAIDLHPMDLNGKADPYIMINLGSKTVNDKENYISKQLNPVFGKCFELEATFPIESILTVKIQDWDLVGTDDVIGETKIDLENRFYSKHRATCGLPKTYEEVGFNRWRDAMKPTQILAKLCKDSKIDPPLYEVGRIRIGKKVFELGDDVTDMLDYDGRNKIFEERLALSVLHRWQEVPRVGCHLVPEHIETRPLYHPNKPGIERGKLEMWVDMFPLDSPSPGPSIDISPRKPKSFELRIIIWNTDDVVLEDDAFFTGEKMSDIYVKGWLKGPEDCQSTDIHYRSLTGEGNFNWRFIFPFEYLVAEEKIVITKKESLFSWDETQSKIPARLEFQVWDADHFSADDFLGAITLDLNRFPRGAKSSKLCTLEMLKIDGSVPMVNIFKQKRVKGWWPFYIKKDNEEMELTGKVEAEIHLLTKEEAEKNPAGLGRNEPDPLEKPNRPDASFMWFLNPLKSLRYIIWHNYKWKVVKISAIFLIVFMIFLFFYAIPGYTVKRLIGA